jgi:L-fuconolactonase
LVARWKWSTEQLRRYADHVVDRFGPNRVMAGSNWPVILLGADFAESWCGLKELIASLSEAEQREIFGGTARRIFSL